MRELVTFTWRYFIQHPEFLSLLATEKKLHDAHQTLDQLAVQLEQANADLAGQQSAFNSSIKSADQTCGKLGDSSAECASARSKSDTMLSAILKAQQTVKLLSGNGSWDQLSAQKDVVAAQAAYDAAAAALKQTASAHDAGVDLIAAQTSYDSAVAQLTSAQAKLDQTRAGATSTDLIAAQKQYARDLLSHVNAYTHARYADEEWR